MAPTLEAARAATRRGAWHLILGLPRSATERDVQKARRELQRQTHQDKGGNPELSALINKAADELLAQLRPFDKLRRQRQDREEEQRQRREEARKQEAERQARMDAHIRYMNGLRLRERA